MEKLLAAGQRAEAGASADAEAGSADPLSYGPRPDQLVPRVASGNAAADDGDGGAASWIYMTSSCFSA